MLVEMLPPFTSFSARRKKMGRLPLMMFTFDADAVYEALGFEELSRMPVAPPEPSPDLPPLPSVGFAPYTSKTGTYPGGAGIGALTSSSGRSGVPLGVPSATFLLMESSLPYSPVSVPVASRLLRRSEKYTM